MAVPVIITRFIASAALKDFKKNGANGWAGNLVSRLKSTIPSQKGGGTPQAAPKGNVKKTGVQGWNDRENGYLPSRSERAITYGLPIIGDVANVVGQGMGTYQDVFGKVLAAAAAADGYRSGVVGSPAALLPIAGGGHIAKGQIYSMIGKAIGNRLAQTSNQLRQENQMARQEALIANTGGMSTAISQLNANPIGSNNNKGATIT